MDCQGDGSCYIQCFCDCFNNCTHECNCSVKFNENGEEIGCECDCGCRHKENCEWVNGIHKDCKNNCLLNNHCELKKCNNFIICNEKDPQWLLNCHYGCCNECYQIYGPLNFLEDIKECCICFENKKQIKLTCNHKLCLDCFKSICKRTSKCPLCRNINGRDWSNMKILFSHGF